MFEAGGSMRRVKGAFAVLCGLKEVFFFSLPAGMGGDGACMGGGCRAESL